jgi:rare lipoprotein A
MGINTTDETRRNCRIVAVAGVCLLLANCASSGKFANNFDPKYGVSSSPRVVDFDQPVPKGGGTYRVGKPYVVGGRMYVPEEDTHYRAEGLASWYGDDFHGRLTANGEVFDMTSLTAAHPTLPMPCYARVTNLSNGKSLIVRVNDRGPYHGNRVIDVSHRAATLLDFQSSGIARVRVEYVGRAPLEGSDDAQLVATLRTNEPAPPPSAVRIASAAPFVPQADPQIRGVVRRDVPLPAERPYALGNADDQTPVAEAVAPSYAGGSRAYASEADAPSAYRGAGYVSSGQNSTANPVLGRGLY